MIVLLSDLIGLPIFTHQEETPIASVKGAIFDPETGILAALSTSFFPLKIIPLHDINHVSVRGIEVKGPDSIVSPDEILRVKEILFSDRPIITQKVYCENNTYLGRVFDLGINFPGNYLVFLNIYKNIFFIKYSGVIVEKKDIIEITKEKIIVKNLSQFRKIKKEAISPSEATLA